MKKKVFVFIIAGCMFLSGCGGGSQKEYDSLKAEYDNVVENNDESYKGNLEIIDESGEVIITMDNLKSVSTSGDDGNGYCVNITLDEASVEKFTEVTTNNIGKTLSIYVDGNLISSKIVTKTIIDGKLVIDGFETRLDAYSIVCDIRDGSDRSGGQTEIAKQESMTEAKITEQQTSAQVQTTELETTKEVPHSDGMYGISDKDIHRLKSSFSADNVRNDTTGKWRISTINETFNVEEYALSYYKSKIYNDNQIHGIVNFANNTTTCISVYGNYLDVTIHEYLDGEEHDANLLFGGNILKEYFVYLDNGDIEEVK